MARRAVRAFRRSLLALASLCVLAVLPIVQGSTSLLQGNRQVPNYVAQFAPLIWLHSTDPFRPSDLLQHLAHVAPVVDHAPVVSGVPAELDLDNLAELNAAGDGGVQVALTAKDDVTRMPAWLLGVKPDATTGKTENATACVVILVEKDGRNVDAFFFYFYSYDRGANITQVLPPLNTLIKDTQHGMHFGDHVGDWEHNMVRFKDGKPTGIYYSQHGDGAAYQWGDSALSRRDERVLTYSAYGSHANYASAGDHVHDSVLVDYCDQGTIWDPVLSAYFFHLDPASFALTRMLPPPALAATAHSSNSSSIGNSTSFFYFTGRWGDAQYPDDDPRQLTVPKFGLKRFVSGPTGPAAKQLVRKGLFPDRRGKKTWVQWAVGVYMSLYPCCLRGWRAWVSMAVFVAVVVLVGCVLARVATRGIKRYRSRGQYKKLDSEEVPLQEMGLDDDNDDDNDETPLHSHQD